MIQTDSRKVKKGDIFVAIKGLLYDGHDYVEEAFKNGAKIVYGERNFNRKNYVRVVDSRIKLGELARDYYGDPSSKLKIIGVTGTKGKTTTCHLIHHILSKSGKKTGLISTISVEGFHTTTPDIVTLNKLLSDFVKQGCEYVVLEVSSHGIHQGRISGIKFDLSVLTNIHPEHLDYHGTFKEYKRIKMLFVNSAKYRVFSPEKSKLNILPGEFNNINAETALKVVHELGYMNYAKNIETLKTFKLPEGRLEEIPNSKGIKIFVDFAHTPDSLEKALLYFKSLKPKRLISVFGCAGERDRKKRSKMGRISTKLADLSIFTSEDPRSENIFKILRQMRSKVSNNNYLSIPERGEAISYALRKAKKGDILVIFGKGHEKTMCYGGKVTSSFDSQTFEHPWSDQDFINNLLNEKKDVLSIILAAGKGTRMKSRIPKVLREICGRPILSYTLESLRRSGIMDINLVVSYRKNEIIRRFPVSIDYKFQLNPKGGTADALLAGLMDVKKIKYVMVMNGDDSAFYKPQTITDVFNKHVLNKSKITFVSLVQKNPHGLGRVVKDKKGLFKAIIEEKDANERIKKIKEVNDGLYVFDYQWVRKNIKKIKKSSITGELYITELLKMAVSLNEKISIYKLPDSNEWQGINTPEQLLEAEEKMKKRLL